MYPHEDRQAFVARRPEDDLDRFANVTERDIDLLLVEEICCNPSFATWIYDQVRSSCTSSTLPELPGVGGVAYHSVSHSGDGAGESDIEAVFSTETGEGRVLVLIENKIDAAFTPDQPQRYRMRLSARAAKRGCSVGAVALVAPAEYAAAASLEHFDVVIAYEKVLEELSRYGQAAADLASRFRHKATLLRHAVERYRRGGAAVVDEQVTRFFGEYEKFVRRQFPRLTLKPSRARGTNSLDVFFDLKGRQELRSESCFLKHGYKRGEVAVVIYDWGRAADWFIPRIQATLPDGMMVRHRPGVGSLQIGIWNLPVMANDQPVEAQVTQLTECMQAAERVQAWYLSHLPQMTEWARQQPPTAS